MSTVREKVNGNAAMEKMELEQHLTESILKKKIIKFKITQEDHPNVFSCPNTKQVEVPTPSASLSKCSWLPQHKQNLTFIAVCSTAAEQGVLGTHR